MNSNRPPGGKSLRAVLYLLCFPASRRLYLRANLIFMSTRPLMPATVQLLENCQ